MGRDSEYVRAYADRYRAMFPIRIATIVGIVAICLWLVDWPWAFNFAACQFGLYALLWNVVGHARRNPGAPGAALGLKRWTEGITFALAAHCSLFVLAVMAMEPHYLRYVLLLIAGNLMVGALQVHISRLSFAAAVTPPALAIAVIAATQPRWDASFKVAFAMFIAGVIGAAWRQMDTDRQAVELQVDLTARTDALERALSEAEAARTGAERANQAKSRFLAMISHDVRTPLNIIMGVVEVMKRKTRPKAEAELVDDMGDAGAMLLRLLNGALDLSKIESGQAEARLAPVDVRSVIEGVGRVWRRRAEELKLDLSVDCDGEAADFRLLADEGRIEQVAINFLSNALKLTPAGTVRITARARPSEDGRVALEVEVADQGPGVPESKRDKIFEPFEQLADGRAAGGAGLGLAICRSSVEAMGGEIGVRAAPGGGAVFWFRITAERALPAAAPVEITPTPVEQARPLSVLAAEDHPANRKLLAMLLEQFAVEVTLVENGAEAVTAAAANRYDLILMDVMMPVLDGVAALTMIRGSGNAVPIHMLTANVFDDDVARYMAAGADGVLKKPIEIAALHAVLMQVGEAEAPPLRMVG